MLFTRFFVRDTQSECSFLDIVKMASKRKQTTQPTSVNRECMLEQLKVIRYKFKKPIKKLSVLKS